MTENADFDLEDFQKKVWEEFHFLKGWKTFKKSPLVELEKGSGKNLTGCLFAPIFFVVNSFAKKFFIKERKKRNHETFEKEAGDLLTHAEIRRAICKSLRETSGKEILTEEKFVRTVTETLAENSLRQQFVIPPEPALFAFVADEISEAGIENFCAEIKKD